MTQVEKHWDAIFAAKEDAELGWYEGDVSQTLKFLDLIPLGENKLVFLAGAGTTLLVDELVARNYQLILNDISDTALAKLRTRIGHSECMTWLLHDLSKPFPGSIPRVDIWIDRAVLHFLLKEVEIRQYFDNLSSAVSSGGYVLLAEFSTTGAKKCAGLELHRYSIEELNERLGENFELVSYEYYTFVNPAGDVRPYIYALYRKLEA